MRILCIFMAITFISLGLAKDEKPETNNSKITPTEKKDMPEKIVKTDEEWKKQLTPEQFEITRKKGTEYAFTGEYYKSKEKGTYLCICCGNELFSSDTKFESGSGWPSFWAPASEEKVITTKDQSHGMQRIEVKCSKCDAHLGHVFEDGPRPTNLRYCINSTALKLNKASEEEPKKELSK